MPEASAALNLSQGLTCPEIYDLWLETWVDPFELAGCYRDIWVHRQCPQEFCEWEAKQFDTNYLGATTEAERKALVWMSRSAAFLSFGGASYILATVLSDPKKRTSVYYRLLFVMAIFDIITAGAWVFATAPIDEDEAGHVYGANGNEATCTAQAFFVQLGFTSVFYNVSLAIYYILVVVYNKKECHLKAIQYYLHGLPILLGVGLSLGAIPIYHWIEYGCHILPPPEGDLWAVLVFVVLPLGISILAITASVLFMYGTVRHRAVKSQKWRLGAGKSSIEAEVFWQCLFYVLAFYITWPILFSVYLASVDIGGPLSLTLTVAFVAPLQGFNNFLVFVRPKVKKFFNRGSSGAKKKGWCSSASRGVLSMLSRLATSATFSESKPQSSSDLTQQQVHSESEISRVSLSSTDQGFRSSSRDNFVVVFEDGTRETLDRHNSDMDPSALLPLRISWRPPGSATTEETAGNPALAVVPESQGEEPLANTLDDEQHEEPTTTEETTEYPALAILPREEPTTTEETTEYPALAILPREEPTTTEETTEYPALAILPREEPTTTEETPIQSSHSTT